MKFKSLGRLLLSLSIIAISPSLVFAHAGHGEHPGFFHWMDHFGEVALDSSGVAVWALPVALVFGSLIWRRLGRSR